MQINIGPIHPSTHGVLRLKVDLDGDTIKRAEPHIGFLHRGVEKLMETRIYMQNPSYAEKLDYIAPLAWDDLYVSAVETATHTEVKEAAQYARVILLEFQRIASHLLWLGTFANDLGQMYTVFMWAFRDRAKVLKLLEDVSGGRMFYVNLRLGGLARELPPDFKERSRKLIDYLERAIPKYKDFLNGSSVFLERTKDVGIIKREEAINWGATGPVLRASGVDFDARKKNPYYMYKNLGIRIPVKTNGDAYDRYRVRYEEMLESLRLASRALDEIPDTSVAGLPIKLVGPNAAEETVIVERELPRGTGILYMVPGKQKPHRIAFRAPSFINLSILPKLCEGARFADLFSILGSLDIVMGEIDK